MTLLRKGSDGALGESENGAADTADFLTRLDRCYRRPLVSFFQKRTREACDIDDLVQEVFMRMLHRSTLHDIDFLQGYVFQTAANVMRDRLRRRAVRHAGQHESLESCELPTNDFSPERVLQGRQQLERAIEAVGELSPRTLEVFVLRLYEGLTLEEIAARLDMSVEGIRFHLRRAKAHIARKLGQQDS